MIIAISGTPGIGKTSAVKKLRILLKANVISLSELMKKKKIRSTYDKKRRTNVVTAKNIRTAVKKEAGKSGKKMNVVDGHLSHFANADLYVILRCRPDVLEKRMKKKGWPSGKISENVRAEVLDTVTIETLEIHPKNKVVEIDTTHEKPSTVARTVANLLNNYHRQKEYSVGQIDWSEKFAKYLINEEPVMTA